MTIWAERLAVVSDEAATGFAEAVRACLPLGIRAYELRALPGGRVPYVSRQAIDEVLSEVQAHNLRLIGLSPGFGKLELDDPAADDELSRGLDVTFSLMDRLGVRRMTMFTYRRTGRETPIPPGVTDRIRRAAEGCRAAGFDLLLENSASCWGDTGEHVAALARAAGAYVTWDPGNAQAAGDRPFPDGYAAVRHMVAHVHCKNWRPEAGWVDINAGLVDMAGQVAALKADGYTGYFCVEPHQWQRRAEAVADNTTQLLQLLERGSAPSS